MTTPQLITKELKDKRGRVRPAVLLFPNRRLPKDVFRLLSIEAQSCGGYWHTLEHEECEPGCWRWWADREHVYTDLGIDPAAKRASIVEQVSQAEEPPAKEPRAPKPPRAHRGPTHSQRERWINQLRRIVDDGERPRQENTDKRRAQARTKQRDAATAARAIRILETCEDATKGEAYAAAQRKGEPVSNGYHQYMVDTEEWADQGARANQLRGLAGLAAGLSPQEKSQRALDALMRNPPEGFFPTPDAAAASLATLAAEHLGRDDLIGCTVLEPSAGTGALALAAWNQGATVTAIESHTGVYQVLCATFNGRANADLYNADFLDADPEGCPQFDAILMNPPYERGQIYEHIMHATQFLALDGVLLAIVPPSARATKDALAQLRGSKILPPEESGIHPDVFNGRDAARRTGVQVGVLVYQGCL